MSATPTTTTPTTTAPTTTPSADRPDTAPGADLVAARIAAARARRAGASAPGRADGADRGTGAGRGDGGAGDTRAAGAAGPDGATSGADAPSPGGMAPAPPPRPEGPPQLSSAQRRLWFLQQLDPSSAAWSIPVVWDLEGPLDEARLETAWRSVVARHEVLRTRIGQVDGEPVAQVDTEAADQWVTTPSADVEADTRAALARPFDLALEQPWRAVLLGTGPTSRRLVLVVHHVAADGWSVEVLLDDLGAAYAGVARPALEWQFADVARHRARLDDGGAGLRHWVEHLSGAPRTLPLPTDRPRPTTADPSGDTVRVRLDADALAGLRAACRDARVTPFVTLLAALNLVLGRWARTDDVVVGTPVAGRDVAAWERLVGCFVNTVALRTTTPDGGTLRGLLEQVHGVTVDALEHQGVPFEQVVEAVAPERDLSTTPVYQVMCTVHTEPEPTFALADVSATWVDVHTDVAKTDLSLHAFGGALDLTSTSTELDVAVTYRTSLSTAPPSSGWSATSAPCWRGWPTASTSP